MDSAFAWKRFYEAERRRMGPDALGAAVAAADPLVIGPGGALVVPHTRLEVTIGQVATAVRSVIDSGADRVLALGVLHGARRADDDCVTRARAGDPEAIAELRGVHDEDGLAAEEFSLDAFSELLALAAGRAGRTIEVVRRYPFLVGTDPSSLPGLDELRRLRDGGAVLVVTTDPIHHGHAYGTPERDRLSDDDPSTIEAARVAISEQFAALSSHRFDAFAALTARDRSDFRDTGPAMAALVGRGFEAVVHDLALVDYSAALDARRPTWVAAALVSL